MSNRRVVMRARTVPRLAAEASPVDWFDATTPGLALHVTPAGSRTWYLFYRHLRTTRRVKLGTYPAVELAKARELARGKRVRVETQGADPAAERRQARAAESIADLCHDYIERHAKARKRSWREDERIINSEVCPAWRNRAVTDIRRRDLHALVQGIADRGAGVMANRVCALLSRLFRFAVDQEIVDANPAAHLPRPTREQSRERVLTHDEIRASWATWDELRPELGRAQALRDHGDVAGAIAIAEGADRLADLALTGLPERTRRRANDEAKNTDSQQ